MLIFVPEDQDFHSPVVYCNYNYSYELSTEFTYTVKQQNIRDMTPLKRASDNEKNRAF